MEPPGQEKGQIVHVTGDQVCLSSADTRRKGGGNEFAEGWWSLSDVSLTGLWVHFECVWRAQWGGSWAQGLSMQATLWPKQLRLVTGRKGRRRKGGRGSLMSWNKMSGNQSVSLQPKGPAVRRCLGQRLTLPSDIVYRGCTWLC